MSRRLSGINPLSYLGVEPYTPPAMLQNIRTPTVNDFANLGDFWLVVPPGYSGPESLWVLISLQAGTATWVQLYPNASSLTFVEDSGSAVPINSIVRVLGDGKVITGGSGNTIQLELSSSLSDSFVTDSGTAVPVAGVIEVLGGANVATMGAGNTITITASSGSDLTFMGNDSSTATSVAGLMNVLGTSVLTTHGSGNTFDIGMTTSTDGQLVIGATSGDPAWANLTSLDGSIAINNGPNTIDLSATGGGGGSGGVVITQFTTSGSWTPNVNTQFVIVYGWNGGGGGGAGSKGVGSQPGGGGGSGGNSVYFMGPIDYFYVGTPIVVTVGAGGAGGTSQAGTGAGGNGGVSGQTTIGNISIPSSAQSAGLGTGSGATSGSQSYVMANGYLVVDGTQIGGNSGGDGRTLDTASVTSSGAVSAFVSPFMCAGAGGGGGGVGVDGGDSGSINLAGNVIIPGVSGGSAGGNGTPGHAAPYTNTYLQEFLTGGGGGSGGSGEDLGDVGNGGVGGFPGGGGGGGGGSSTVASGSGGSGGGGLVVFIEFF